MRRVLFPVLACAVVCACGPRAGTLEGADAALRAAETSSIEFSGSGRWYQFGQAPNAKLPWPQYDVSSYKATINYATPSARVQMTRMQTVDPTRVAAGSRRAET